MHVSSCAAAFTDDVMVARVHRFALPPGHLRRCVLFQLTCALGYMHATGVVHRDLKPANVLLDLDCHVRLCDFGLCRTIPTAGQGGALATPRADAPGAAAASG